MRTCLNRAGGRALGLNHFLDMQPIHSYITAQYRTIRTATVCAQNRTYIFFYFEYPVM